MTTRHTDAEKELAIDTLMLLKARGASRMQLIAYGTKHYDRSERQIERYLSEGKDREVVLAKMPVAEHLGAAIAQFRYLYAEAVMKDNLELARKLKVDEIKFIFSFNKLSGGNRDASLQAEPEISQDELDAIIEALGKKGNSGPEDP